MGDSTIFFRDPYLIWQNSWRVSWRKMSCPLEANQSEQGKDPGKYKFSPSLAEVSWTFHGLTSSLWSLMTMTEGISVQMSQTIWLPLPSGNYSFDDHQWASCRWGQWKLVLLYPLLHVALLLAPSFLKCAALSFQDTHILCFSSCFSFPHSQHPLLFPFFHLYSNIDTYCPSLSSLSTPSEKLWDPQVSVFAQHMS